MCLPMCTIITVVNLDVVIGVVHGRAWNKATTQSWSLNRSYLIPSFFEYVD
jgi:hypothetical protein